MTNEEIQKVKDSFLSKIKDAEYIEISFNIVDNRFNELEKVTVINKIKSFDKLFNKYISSF